MDLGNMDRIDPNVLLGIINEKLRLQCQTLDDLFYEIDMPQSALLERMDSIGYHYDPLSNQFKQL